MTANTVLLVTASYDLAPGLMRDVYLGTLYMDGMAIEATVEEVAA